MAVETQTETSKITPNSTQVPNLYLDQYMAFLTGEEWKVLSYTVRRTMGFHKLSDQISLSQYASGLTTKDGKRLDFGTGLSKPAVAKAVGSLVTFGLLIEVKPPRGNAGGVYALQLDDNQINHDAILNRSNEQSKKNGRRTSNMRARLVEQRAVSATDCNQSDNPVAVSATNRSAVSATNTQKKEKERGKKDSLSHPPDGVATDAPEEPEKAVEPTTVKESIEAKLPLPTPPGPGLQWYMTAGDNYLLHAAAPTPSGKQIKPICGAAGNYAALVTEQTVIGNRKPCQDCQRKAASKAALAVAGAKAPRKAQPYDVLFDAIGEHIFDAKDAAGRAAVAGRIAPILHGDKRGGRCIGIIQYECLRQSREANELDYNVLAEDVSAFMAWFRANNRDITIADCAKVLDYWQKWRSATKGQNAKWTYDPATGWKEPTNAK